MDETRRLARFVSGTGFDDLPAEVVECAQVFMLDNIASGMLGSVQPWSGMVAEMIREAGSKGECTVFGQPWRTNASGAALVNGVMIGAFESDHSSMRASAHPSGTVFPAAMAMAEREHKDGKLFVTAMVLGYETVCRIGEAATRAVEDERGFHGPGTNGQFGAAMAAGKLLGLDEARLTNALGIAGSHSAGLMEFVWEGAMTKRLHLGRGSQMGLESALLAGKGYTGPSTVLEGKHGFFNVFSPSPQPERLLADLGKVWLSKDLQLKPYACHGTQQAFVQGLQEFKARHKIDAKDIRRVTVAAGRRMVHNHDDKEPTTIMGLQLSMPFVVAIALAKDIGDPYVINEKTLWDSGIRELAKRVETVVDPRFAAYTGADHRGEITIELANERHVIDIHGFKGSLLTPFDLNDACDKLRRYAAPIIGKQRAEAILDKVCNIASVADMSEVARLFGT